MLNALIEQFYYFFSTFYKLTR